MNITFPQQIILGFVVGLILGTFITNTINIRTIATDVKAIKEHTEKFYSYKIEMDELALDVWCKPSNNAQEQVNCIRDNIYMKAK